MTRGMRFLFYGTDTLSTAVLSRLHGRPDLSSLHVVTKNTSSPVHRYCTKHSIDVEVHDKGRVPRKGDSLEEWQGVVASFGNLIPGRVIRGVGGRFVNVHPSLIPKHQVMMRSESDGET